MSARTARTADGTGDPLEPASLKDLETHRLKKRVDSASYGTCSVDRHFTRVIEANLFSIALKAHDEGFFSHD